MVSQVNERGEIEIGNLDGAKQRLGAQIGVTATD